MAAAHGLAAALGSARRRADLPDAVDEWVVGFGNVVVHLEPGHEPPDVVARWLGELTTRCTAAGRIPGPRPSRTGSPLVIPASFVGPDLEEVASLVGATPAEVVDRLTGTSLAVAFVGFSPGFPYLVGLPPELASVPRRPTPRPSVPAGSVAIGGGFASVYPQSTPGGWMLLGRTSVSLFDPAHPPYARLRPGDVVRFSDGRDRRRVRFPAGGGRRTGHTGPAGTVGGPLRRGGRSGAPEPGRGRRSPRGGGPGSAAGRARRPGGHGPGQSTGGEPGRGRGHRAHRVGPDAPLPRGRPRRRGGRWGRRGRGRRGRPPRRDRDRGPRPRRSDPGGGRGPHRPAGLPGRGRRLRYPAGGRLPVVGPALWAGSGAPASRGPAGARVARPVPAAGWRPTRGRPAPATRQPVRVLPGPHRIPADQLETLLSRTWQVGASSNRIGLRLLPAGRPSPGTGPAPPAPGLSGRGVRSTGMVTGAIQVPPDGRPIVLMPDHATVGGYPVIACVIAVDLPVLGRLRPGDLVDLVARGPAEAAREALAGGSGSWPPRSPTGSRRPRGAERTTVRARRGSSGSGPRIGHLGRPDLPEWHHRNHRCGPLTATPGREDLLWATGRDPRTRTTGCSSRGRTANSTSSRGRRTPPFPSRLPRTPPPWRRTSRKA